MRYIISVIAMLTFALVIAYLFYRSWIGLLPGILVATVIMRMSLKKDGMNKRSYVIFKGLLNNIYSELIAGKSFKNAIIASNTSRHEDHIIYTAFSELAGKMQMNVSDVEAWLQFKEKVNIEVVDQFVFILSHTYKLGGNVTHTIKRSSQIIADQIELDLEIDVLLSAKKFEFYLMMFIPLVIFAMLSLTSDGYMDVLYLTLMGRIVMSLVLLFMTLAYTLGLYLIKIEV